MPNAMFEPDVDLHKIAAAAQLGYTFRSGKNFVSLRRPGRGATMIYGPKAFDLEILRDERVPGFFEAEQALFAKIKAMPLPAELTIPRIKRWFRFDYDRASRLFRKLTLASSASPSSPSPCPPR